jgi:hypothetical protein
MIKIALAGVLIALIAINAIAQTPAWHDIRLDCGQTVGTVHVLIPLGEKKQLRMTFTCEADA